MLIKTFVKFDRKDVVKLASDFRKIRYQRMIEWTRDYYNNTFLPYLKKTKMSGTYVKDKNGYIFNTFKPDVVRSSDGISLWMRMSWLASFLNDPHPINKKDKLLTVPVGDLGFGRGEYKQFVDRVGDDFALLPIDRGLGKEYVAGYFKNNKFRAQYMLLARVEPKKSRGYLDDALKETFDDYQNYIEEHITEYF
ncbi:MAG: hypothetical protein AB7E09_07235 [Candidatus Izemoplasmatales bacterium]